jgi:hypothetical protein
MFDKMLNTYLWGPAPSLAFASTYTVPTFPVTIMNRPLSAATGTHGTILALSPFVQAGSTNMAVHGVRLLYGLDTTQSLALVDLSPAFTVAFSVAIADVPDTRILCG